ncbi:MAG: hypothetical protein H0W05_04455 [Thermoleophilaceae bacterium]|nr:hypothetical protein [Thermoleophilaceae bacterium]
MTFLRLSRGHVIAAVAALALLLAMGVIDWYSTVEGEEARRTEQITGEPAPGLQGEIDREVLESSSTLAEENEELAVFASDAADRIVLVLLLATVVLALAAAVFRAAGRRFPGPLPPSALAAILGAAAALAVTVRIIQVGAFESGGEIEAGAPLALVVLGVLAFGAARAARVERAEREAGRAAPTSS